MFSRCAYILGLAAFVMIAARAAARLTDSDEHARERVALREDAIVSRDLADRPANQPACEAFYGGLKSAQGDALVQLLETGDLACIEELEWTTDRALQRAVATERNQIDVAAAIESRMGEYDGIRVGALVRLINFMLVTQDIHHWCVTKQSCSGNEFADAAPWSIAPGSEVHRAVRGAIVAFVENEHFGSVADRHLTMVWTVVRFVKRYQQQGDHLNMVVYWLTRWESTYSRRSSTREIMRDVIDILYSGHRVEWFGRYFGEHRPLAELVYEFASNRELVGTASAWLVEELALALARYTAYPGTANYEWVAPKIRQLLADFENDPQMRPIALRIVAEIDYNATFDCERYDICEWYGGEGFRANFRNEVFPQQMRCPANFCPNDTIDVYAQSVTQDQLVLACERLNDWSAHFHELFDTGCDPVAGDVNSHLDAFIFNDGASCEAFESAAFYRNADSCSGIYWEGEPDDPFDDPATFVVTEYTPDENPLDPDLAIWNFPHEYAHYLDGRYNRSGGYRGAVDGVWWTEGFAEYFATDVDPYKSRPSNFYDPHPYSLADIMLRSGSIPTRYRFRHLAVRFFWENDWQFLERMLQLLRAGDLPAYSRMLVRNAATYQGAWEEWLRNPSNGGYCYGRPTYGVYGHIAEVRLGTMRNATGPNNGEYTFHAQPAIAEAGSSVDLRISVGTTIDVFGDTNVVEAWIDWNEDGRFDDATEKVLDRQVVLDLADGPPVVVSTTVQVPEDAAGAKRVRVRVLYSKPLQFSETAEIAGPCGDYESGEIEDYVLRIGAAPIRVTSSRRAFELGADSGDVEVDLADVFVSTNGQRLALRVAVDGDLVVARIEGSTLKMARMEGATTGQALVTVTATNDDGESATATFRVSLASSEGRLGCDLPALLAAANDSTGNEAAPGVIVARDPMLVVEGSLATISAAANGVCTATIDLAAEEVCGAFALGCAETSRSEADSIYCAALSAFANQQRLRVHLADGGDGEVCRVDRLDVLAEEAQP